MNKTVNINIAGIFFHIDDDAYLKLQRYLEAIKQSFSNTDGQEEILSDIEARIAELFNERKISDKHVINNQDVEEIIKIMGQPEDYLVDDELFDEQPKHNQNKATKKLFRNTDNSYIAGVSSGLAHYFGIQPLWIRLLWIFLTIGSSGYFILIYIIFWVLVPEAKTTSEKLRMTGEEVTISNIEKKIKDGIDNVSDTVKNVDYKKHSNSIKSTSKSFFDTIGAVLGTLLSIFGKFIGVILIVVSGLILFGFFISLVSLGGSSIFFPDQLEYLNMFLSNDLPIWLASIFIFLVIGIPIFFMFYLGLKILINNLKSIGRIAKLTLLGLWLISFAGLVLLGIREASNFKLTTEVSDAKVITVPQDSTFTIAMKKSGFPNYSLRHDTDFHIEHTTKGNKVLFSRDVAFNVESSNSNTASIEIIKESHGKNFNDAKARASEVIYNYSLDASTLNLDGHWITDLSNKYRDQEVSIIVSLPENTVFKLDENTKSFLNRSRNTNIPRSNAGHLLKVSSNGIECLDCDEENNDDEFLNIDISINDSDSISTHKDSFNLRNKNIDFSIGKKGIYADGEDVKVEINENGIKIIKKDSLN